MGYVIAMKTPGECGNGDTLAAVEEEGDEAPQPIVGFQPAQPMVFAGLFPGQSLLQWLGS